MTNREPKLSRPSAATHHLTQASTTLNRRYVKRPQTIRVNHISDQAAAPQTKTTSAQPTPATPHVTQITPGTSRLVNLGVHAKDLPHPAPTSTRPAAPAIKISVKSATQPANPPAQPTTQPTPKVVTQPTPKVSAQPAPKPAPKPATPCETVISRANQDTFGLQPESAQPSATKAQPSASSQSTKAQPGAAKAQTKQPSASTTQLDTLKAFAAEVKHHPTNSKLEELSNTIDQVVAVIEKSNRSRITAETKVAASVTTSPKITRAAAKATPSIRSSAPAVQPAPKPTPQPTIDLPAQTHPLQATANRRIRSAKTRPAKPSSKDIKDRAIKQALRSVATMSETPAQPIKRRKSGGAKRFILAFTCAAACLAAVIYFVSSNIPDVSVRVAAMQTGIEASYPSYVPMDYSLSDIISEDGKLTMIFNGPDGARFTLVQEKSSWDSATLLRNYVEPTWGSDYVTTHEQGITIYISNQTNDSTWVNGGIRYSITSEGARLTKKQTRNIVLSL